MPAMTWSERVRLNAARFGSLVAGIDPNLADVPAAFGSDAGWIGRYVSFLLSALDGRVGFVKFQAAYFEAMGLAGLTALSEAMKQARAAGMGIILDAKRGDIGTTAAAYAKAYLTPEAAGGGGDFEADCLTVNPLMGPDTLEPFTACVRDHGKGLFVLCRTSNPGAGWLQDLVTENLTVSERLAGLVTSLGTPLTQPGELSPIGAVIGATVAAESRRLRGLLPNAIILAPGLGPQGGDPGAIQCLRGGVAGDLLVPVSRGLTGTPDKGISLADYAALIQARVAGLRAQVDPA